jgi:DNA-binding transcriptional ArsR family regulator
MFVVDGLAAPADGRLADARVAAQRLDQIIDLPRDVPVMHAHDHRPNALSIRRQAGFRAPDRSTRGLRSRATTAMFTLMGEYSAGVLDRVFSAVADPTRRAILARLADSDARVTDVASAFPISLNSTSKHIRVLEGAGLVRRSVRGREHILSLHAAPLAEAAGWIEHYRTFWTDQLASLDAFVTIRDNAERSS